MFHLPYYDARMFLEREGFPPSVGASAILYGGVRRWPGFVDASYLIRAEAVGPIEPARAGTLEHFLVERYVLYAEHRGRLFQGRVRHAALPAAIGARPRDRRAARRRRGRDAAVDESLGPLRDRRRRRRTRAPATPLDLNADPSRNDAVAVASSIASPSTCSAFVRFEENGLIYMNAYITSINNIVEQAITMNARGIPKWCFFQHRQKGFAFCGSISHFGTLLGSCWDSWIDLSRMLEFQQVTTGVVWSGTARAAQGSLSIVQLHF